jgi:hypothetical protein
MVKGKFALVPRHHAMKKNRECVGQALHILNLTLETVEWSASRSVHFTPEKEPSDPVGEQKTPISAGNRTAVVQPVIILIDFSLM